VQLSTVKCVSLTPHSVEIGPIEGTFNDLGEIIESKHATVKADRRLLYYYAYNYSKLACAPGIPGIRAIKFDTVTGVTIEVFLLWLRREYEIDKAENKRELNYDDRKATTATENWKTHLFLHPYIGDAGEEMSIAALCVELFIFAEMHDIPVLRLDALK
jgi:hypothetical protein